MAEDESSTAKSAAERWFEEQQAWQQTMRDYADAMVQDEQFLMHLGNAMRGSLLGGSPYPQAANSAPGAAAAGGSDRIDEVLFALKQVDGRLRDIETAIADLTARVQSG